jgi:hypothetical protein
MSRVFTIGAHDDDPPPFLTPFKATPSNEQVHLKNVSGPNDREFDHRTGDIRANSPDI